MLGCSIDTLEPVSNIRLLDIPSISTDSGCAMLQQNGNRTHYNSIVRGIQVEGAAFIHTSFSHFPDFLFPVLLPFSFRLGAYHQGSVNVHVENIHLGSSLIDFNECKTEKCHKFTNMGKVKRLEL
jgi:hypothetical protein